MRNKSGSSISSLATFDGGSGMEYSSSKVAIIDAVWRLVRGCGKFNTRVDGNLIG